MEDANELLDCLVEECSEVIKEVCKDQTIRADQLSSCRTGSNEPDAATAGDWRYSGGRIVAR